MVKRAGAVFAREELLLYLPYPQEAGGRAKGIPLKAPRYLPTLSISSKVHTLTEKSVSERKNFCVRGERAQCWQARLLWRGSSLHFPTALSCRHIYLGRYVRYLPACQPRCLPWYAPYALYLIAEPGILDG